MYLQSANDDMIREHVKNRYDVRNELNDNGYRV